MGFPIIPMLGSAIAGKAASWATDKLWDAGKGWLSGGLVPNGADLGLDTGEGGPTSLLAGLNMGYDDLQGGETGDAGGIPRNIQEWVNQGYLQFDSYGDEGPEGISPGPRYAELTAMLQGDPAGFAAPNPVPTPTTPTVTADAPVTPLPTVDPGNNPSPGVFGPDNIYAPVDFGSVPQSMTPQGGDFFTAGLPSFVPDTMGLSMDVSKSLFDTANMFEKQAAEFDISPLVNAGKESFALRRQDVQKRRDATKGQVEAMFSRNKVAGSSLAAAALGSIDSEFAQEERALAAEEAKFSAQAKLQELATRSELMQRASTTRTQAFTSRIDTMLKVADLGAKDAQIRAGLIDSANRLKGVMAEIEEATMRTRMQLMAQEAQSIRSNLTNINIANIQADVSREQIEAGIQNNRDRIDFERDAGVGGLFTPVIAPVVSQIGNTIADKFFGGWGQPTITESGPVWYR